MEVDNFDSKQRRANSLIRFRLADVAFLGLEFVSIGPASWKSTRGQSTNRSEVEWIALLGVGRPFWSVAGVGEGVVVPLRNRQTNEKTNKNIDRKRFGVIAQLDRATDF